MFPGVSSCPDGGAENSERCTVDDRRQMSGNFPGEQGSGALLADDSGEVTVTSLMLGDKRPCLEADGVGGKS